MKHHSRHAELKSHSLRDVGFLRVYANLPLLARHRAEVAGQRTVDTTDDLDVQVERRSLLWTAVAWAQTIGPAEPSRATPVLVRNFSSASSFWGDAAVIIATTGRHPASPACLDTCTQVQF
jgi:hypothetical protein